MKITNITIAELCSQRNARVADLEGRGVLDKYSVPWDYFVWRKISPYIAWLFLKLGISANTITFLSFLIACGGCVLLAFGNQAAMIIGAVLINMGLALDFVDGAVARATNSSSRYGALLDSFRSMVALRLLFIALGIAAFRELSPYLYCFTDLLSATGVNKNIFLILGGWTAVCLTFPRLLYSQYELLFSRKISNPAISFGKGNLLLSLIRRIMVTLDNIFAPLLLMATVFRLLGFFLLFYTFFYTALVIYELIQVLSSARSIGQK